MIRLILLSLNLLITTHAVVDGNLELTLQEVSGLRKALFETLEKVNQIEARTKQSKPPQKKNHSAIVAYMDRASRCYNAILLQVRILFHSYATIIPLLGRIVYIVNMFAWISWLGLLIGYSIRGIKAAWMPYELWQVVGRNIPEILCALTQFGLKGTVGLLSKLGVANIMLDQEFYNLATLVSNIAFISLISNLLTAVFDRLIIARGWILIVDRLLKAILSIKVIKATLISFMFVTNYADLGIFKQDINHIEALLTVVVVTFILLRVRNKVNLKGVQFRAILKYISLPIIAMAVISYASNNQGLRLTYKLLLASSVWPILYQVYGILKALAYLYVKRLPRYSLKYAIQIFLITTNTLRYMTIPLSVLAIMYVFDINLLAETRSFLGYTLYRRIIMLSILFFLGRIAFILNVYLCSLYAQVNSAKRPFDKQRITTSSIIMKNIFASLLAIIILLILLSIFGFDISPLFQTLGLFSAAMSLSLQQVIRDIVNGIFILYENSIRIGDWIEYENRTATVEDMSLRYMRVRLDDGLLITIPFHRLDIIKNKSRQYSYIVLNMSLDRKTELSIAEKAIEEAFKNIRDKPEFKYKILKDIEMRDLADVTAFSYVMQCRICVQPNSQFKVKRAFHKELKLIFDKYEISIATPLVANATNVPSLSTSDPYPDFQ